MRRKRFSRCAIDDTLLLSTTFAVSSLAESQERSVSTETALATSTSASLSGERASRLVSVLCAEYCAG